MEDFCDTPDRGTGMHIHDGIWPVLQRCGGEWSAGWHLMQVGPKRTPVIMKGTGEGLCQGLTTLQSFPYPTSVPTPVLLDAGAQRWMAKVCKLG